MNIEEKFPLIDAYLMHQISDEENQELTELRKYPEFEEEFVFRKEAYESIKRSGRQTLKNRFSELDKPKAKILQFKYWWAVAVVFALFAVAIPFLFDSESSQDLYAAYYSKMENKVVPITRGDSDPDELKLAFVEYQRGNYEKAVPTFESQLSERSELAVYLGVIKMEEEKYKEAIQILEPVSKRPDNRFHTDAKWYLALSYLASSQEDKAIATLKEISVATSRFNLRASKLLSELED